MVAVAAMTEEGQEAGTAGDRPACGGDRHLVVLSAQTAQGILASSLSHLLRSGTIIRLLDYLCRIITVQQIERIQIECALIGSTHGSTVRPDPSYLQPSPIPFILIAELSPYRFKWTIKTRVTARSAIQHSYNPRGEAKTLDFDLCDAQGGEIRAKCFPSAVDKLYDLIEVDKVYLISSGLVKPAQKGYNPFNSDYELALDTSASIEICSSDNM